MNPKNEVGMGSTGYQPVPWATGPTEFEATRDHQFALSIAVCLGHSAQRVAAQDGQVPRLSQKSCSGGLRPPLISDFRQSSAVTDRRYSSRDVLRQSRTVPPFPLADPILFFC